MSEMHFSEIGERLGISTETARLTYVRAMAKLRTHMMDYTDFKDQMDNGINTDNYARLVAAAVELGSMLERQATTPRRDRVRAESALKMAYRSFVKGQE